MILRASLFLGFWSLSLISFCQPAHGTGDGPQLILPVGHSDNFKTLLSDDAKVMVTYTDKIIKIWNADAGKLLRNIELESIVNVEFDKSAKNILVAWKDNVKMFSVATGELLPASFHHRGIKLGVFSSAKNFIITTGDDSTTRVWNISGKLEGVVRVDDGWKYDFNAGRVTRTQFNEATNRIVTDVDSVSVLWNWTTKKEIARFTYQSYSAGSILSPKGKLLLVPAPGDSDVMKLYDGVTGARILALENTEGNGGYGWHFSPDEKYLAGTYSTRGELTGVWSTVSGKRIFYSGFMPCSGSYESYGCEQPMYLVNSSTFDPRSTVLVVTGLRYPSNKEDDNDWFWFVKTHDLKSGRVIDSVYNICDQGLVFETSSRFSNDSKLLFTSYRDQSKQMNSGIIVYDAPTKKVLREIRGGNFDLKGATVSAGGERLMITTDEEFPPVVYDMETGMKVSMLKEATPYRWPTNNKFSFDYTRALSFDTFGDPILWNTTSGEIVKVFSGGTARNTRFAVDAYTNKVPTHAFMSYRFTTHNAFLVNLAEPEKMIPYVGGFSVFSDDGSHFAYYNYEEGSVLIQPTDSVDSLQSMVNLSDHLAGSGPGKDVRVKVSNDGKLVSLEDWRGTFVIEPGNNKLLKKFWGRKTITFSPDGKFFIAIGDKSVRAYSAVNANRYLWDMPFTSLIDSIETFYSIKPEISPDNSRVMFTTQGNAAVLNAVNGERIKQIRFIGELKEINWARSLVLSTYESRLILTSFVTGEQLMVKTFLGASDWVVTHSSGLFDATPAAMQTLYFVQGMDIIQFDQLKDRYYEPGLWKKIMKGEDLRKTTGLKAIDLPPDVRVKGVDAQGYFEIELTNRGGGIGEVSILIQGKEVVNDARSIKTADVPSMKIRYFVGNHKNLTSGENFITVKAWNKDHWVVSRGEMITFTKDQIDNYQPAVHIVACGISDYAGGKDIDLTYAAKDADDMGASLLAGANRLFGTTRTNLHRLTTSAQKENWPTKKNITAVFSKIASQANPRDIIVVYLSGHGTNIGGPEGDWYYLTQDAYTTNPSAYNDPAIRQQTTLSSNELVDMFKTIPAAKQVLVIDACASGKVVDNLIVKRDVPSSTLRALDRMKDRIGLHIITGCTADAVSYEASRYGQGVLTYSLLEGIRGAALRDNEFVDVNKLFQYAQERVPILATGIGGIQTPVTFSPNGSQSFDIGQLNEEDREKIPISEIRPVYIESNFQDDDEMSDVLGLGKKVDELLTEEAARGVMAPVIFVPVREYPDGCQLVGRYKKENDVINLKLRKRCGGTDQVINVSGKTAEELSAAIVSSIKD
jgi:WD40 repeat protein